MQESLRLPVRIAGQNAPVISTFRPVPMEVNLCRKQSRGHRMISMSEKPRSQMDVSRAIVCTNYNATNLGPRLGPRFCVGGSFGGSFGGDAFGPKINRASVEARLAEAAWFGLGVPLGSGSVRFGWATSVVVRALEAHVGGARLTQSIEDGRFES